MTQEQKQLRYQRFEQLVGPWMLFLSVLFIVVFLATFLPSLPAGLRLLSEQLSWCIWTLFAVEFVVRLFLAPSKLEMLRTHLFDLLVLVLPMFRVLRTARALRGLGRAFVAIGGMTLSGRALGTTRKLARNKGIPYVLAIVLLATLAGALIVMQLEADSPDRNIAGLGDAVWWAVSTVTTVGYGDRYPTTTEGRVVAFSLMLLGLGLFSLVTARIAAFFMGDDEPSEDMRAAMTSLHARLDHLETLITQTQSAVVSRRAELASGESDSP